MNAWILSLVVAALLGAALNGGVFFAFSSFVMKALSRVPSAEGIRAMQSINVVVINPAFIGVFAGTALLCLAIVLRSLFGGGESVPHWFLAGALLYVLGTFLVTALANVPLNDRLESIVPEDGEQLWSLYVDKWTFWNHIRTAAAMIAALCFTVGLLVHK